MPLNTPKILTQEQEVLEESPQKRTSIVKEKRKFWTLAQLKNFLAQEERDEFNTNRVKRSSISTHSDKNSVNTPLTTSPDRILKWQGTTISHSLPRLPTDTQREKLLLSTKREQDLLRQDLYLIQALQDPNTPVSTGSENKSTRSEENTPERVPF